MTQHKINAPVIFIAHASSDAEFANAIKQEIDRVFANGLKVFCTSSPEAILVGRDWLNDIEKHLKIAQALVALITPASVEKSWLWFEIGAIWSKGRQGECRIYPLCTPEIDSLDLPSPLDRLQALWVGTPANCRTFIDALVTQFGFGNVSSFRPSNVVRRIPAYRGNKVSDFEFNELYGFGSGHYAWKVISSYRSLNFTDHEGTRLSDNTNNIRFDLFTRLVLGLLSTERPSDGFTNEYVYMRLWKALQQVSEGQREIRFAASDFVNSMEVLKVIEVVDYGYGQWSLTLLGRQLLERWPKSFIYFSDEEVLEILNISEAFEFPALEEAEEALSNYF
jgi:hypothetical protein